jgi:hypothetical protein
MSNLPTLEERCILLRSGMEIWVSKQRADALTLLLKREEFIQVDEEVINRFNVEGIFTPGRMEERRRRQNGQWMCKLGTWHDKGEKCECKPVVGKVHYRVPELGIEFTANKRDDQTNSQKKR